MVKTIYHIDYSSYEQLTKVVAKVGLRGKIINVETIKPFAGKTFYRVWIIVEQEGGK